jgi:hypothetical protein
MSSSENPSMTALNSPLARLGRSSLRRVSSAALYDAWRLAETEATLALAAWRSARRSEKGAAYALYVAALAVEAEAAGRLQGRLAAGAA